MLLKGIVIDIYGERQIFKEVDTEVAFQVHTDCTHAVYQLP